VALGDGFGPRAVRSHLRVRAGMAKEEGPPFAGFSRSPARLPDSVRIRGPERFGLLARRPPAQALLRLDARERLRPCESADHLSDGERGYQTLMPPNSRGSLRALSE
jgi:hypothetical protein